MGFNVLSAEISHETNTFSIHPTDLKSFQDRYFLDGERAIADRGDQNTELAGLLDAARAHGWTVEHVLSAAAGPGGPVTRSAFDALVDPLVAAARKGGFDGVLLMLHGAMVTDFCEDGEGEILDRLRTVVGPALPIAITLDPHANVTEKMCAQADILVSFTTYPHVDMRATGRRVAELLHRTMLDEIRPKTLRVHRPMLEEVNGGRTDIGPMIDRHALSRAHEASRDIYAISINGGFASADIAEVGPTVLVTYGGRTERPLEIANVIADDIWNCRHDNLNDYISVREAARLASGWAGGSGPLVIADYADNPGAGAYGDGTALLASLIEADVEQACFGPLIDGVAASHLADFDIGATAQLDIGGKTAPDFGGGPLRVEGILMWKGEGQFKGDGPILGGLLRNFGPTAVLRVSGIDILIVTIAHQMLDLQQFRAFGIEPSEQRVVALKSMQHFRAAFGPIAGRTIVCDSGALCTTRFDRLPYKRIPTPTFPIDAS